MCGLDRTTVGSSANVHHYNNVSTGMYRYNERQSQCLLTIHYMSPDYKILRSILFMYGGEVSKH